MIGIFRLRYSVQSVKNCGDVSGIVFDLSREFPISSLS